MAAGDTAEATVLRPSISEIPGNDDEALEHLSGRGVVALSGVGAGGERGGAVVRVQLAPLHALGHAHAVEAVEAEAVAEAEAQDGHDGGVVE